MESLIIPGLFAVVVLILVLAQIKKENGFLEILTFIVITLAIGALIVCPLIRNLASRGDAIRAQSYYENIIEPHIIEEFEGYVVVDSDIAPAIWQSGDYNLSTYNSYLKSTRYWDSIVILGSMVYPPPKELKFARVQ